MAVAIKTKFLGPTNYRGSRIRASVMYMWSDEVRSSITLNWDWALNVADNHAAAAKALAQHLGWDGDWHAGDTEDGHVWIRVGEASKRFSVS